MSGSLRNWAHFIRLRADTHAQPEATELAVAIRAILRDHFPRSVDALIGAEDE
jgi:thymidylate synthase ThyX